MAQNHDLAYAREEHGVHSDWPMMYDAKKDELRPVRQDDFDLLLQRVTEKELVITQQQAEKA